MGIQLEKSKVEEKVKLIIKCAKTGEEITRKTIYQGKTIGVWLIQYRNQINKGKLNISADLLKQLEELGLLDRKIDSNIEEKIQEIIEWNKEYPFARVTNLSCNMQELRRYTNSDKEYEKLLEKYERMQGHYVYIRSRKSQGKLTPEQEKRCREGNIRGVFGYPTKTIDLSRKYGLNLDKIDYILSKYGKMENFAKAYINGKLDNEDMRLLSDNLNTFIDISKKGDIRHIKFVKYFAKHMKKVPIMQENNNEIKFFDSTKIPELISRLTPKRAQIINLSFGFVDGKEIPRKEIAEMFKVTIQAITTSLQKSFLKLARYEKGNSTVFQGGELELCKKQQKPTVKEKKKMDSILRRIYSSNLIFIPDEGFTQEPNNITSEELASIAAQIKKFRQEKMQLEEQNAEIEIKNKGFERKSFTPIENLDISVRAYNIFGRNGIKTVEQLRYKKEEDVARLKGMGTKTLEEVKEKVRAIIQEGEEIFTEDNRQEAEVLVDELMISDELFELLKKANINTVADLRHLTRFELENIKGIKEHGHLESIRIELKKLEKKYGKPITELERLKHLKAEKEDEDAVLRKKTQDASELLDSYEKLAEGNVQENEEEEQR